MPKSIFSYSISIKPLAHVQAMYANQDLVRFFLNGISTGFRIGFRIGYQTHAPNLHSCKENLQVALSH